MESLVGIGEFPGTVSLLPVNAADCIGALEVSKTNSMCLNQGRELA